MSNNVELIKNSAYFLVPEGGQVLVFGEGQLFDKKVDPIEALSNVRVFSINPDGTLRHAYRISDQEYASCLLARGDTIPATLFTPLRLSEAYCPVSEVKCNLGRVAVTVDSLTVDAENLLWASRAAIKAKVESALKESLIANPTLFVKYLNSRAEWLLAPLVAHAVVMAGLEAR